MPEIRMYVGLPGSGKSTHAMEFVRQNPNWKRVCKDDLRKMLDGGKWSKAKEAFILHVRDEIITDALTQGYNVIVDDTNLHPKHLERMTEIATTLKAVDIDVRVEAQLFDVPLMECIRRDSMRPDPVGAKVIFGMWEQFLKPKPPEYDHNKPDAIIVDVDGTLATKNGRGAFEWAKVGDDECNFDIANLVALMSERYRVIIVSGRPEEARADTEEWLSYHLIPYHHLYMRADNDFRLDAVVKEEIYNRHIKNVYNVEYVLDDRDQVVEMWRSKGLRVLQVHYGPF